jgi:hypothetical protein
MMEAHTDNIAARLGEEFSATPAAVTLWALKSVYAHLENCIAQMELATVSPKPDMRLLANARFKISQASLARRQLLHQACGHLLGLVTPTEAQMVRSLKRDSADNATASTEHVRRWPVAQVEREWNAYREASRQVRARMKQAIRFEQRLLFPLLARYEQN